ncbi:MAG: hydroxyacid dehydrogenase [Planctomycetes bacterium]|nr:hydroxyacid dehydrogenase [Planctomycetota bacterium]
MRVHIQRKPETVALEALRAALADDIEVTFGDEPLPCTVLVCGRPEREWIEALPGLQKLVIPFAGLPAATVDVMREFPHVAVHNLHHNAAATAELAITLLLAAAKSVVPINAQLRSGDWSARGNMGRALQLDGRSALVLGYGAIGRRVARTCTVLGMKVRAVTRREHADSEHELHRPEALARLLPQADALVVCLPATTETEGLLGREQLELLPPSAIVVNVARGPIIDEAALFDVLKRRSIFAAGLDVWWNYPQSEQDWGSTLPSSQPFHELENVVMSPHRGGHVSDTETQRMLALAELLNAVARGEQVPNQVDLAAGY